MCKVLKIARSTYYSVLNHKPSNREIENNLLKSRIFQIYCDNRKVYGCIKITRILRNQGNPRLSVNRVSRLMKQLDIKAVTVRKFRHYRRKQAVNSEFKNLVNQHFSAEKPDQLWLSDITYIHTVKHGWTYLASILDVCTRKIVAYSYGRKMDRSLVISALEKPGKAVTIPKTLFFTVILVLSILPPFTWLPQIEWALYFLTAKKAVLLIMLLWNLFILF